MQGQVMRKGANTVWRRLALLAAVLPIAACSQGGSDLTGAGEINVAGCSVPAGIDRKAAEAITCSEEKKPAEQTSAGKPDLQVISEAAAASASADSGLELVESYKLAIGDLNGDGVPDVAAVYTLESNQGGAIYAVDLAVFLREGNQLKPGGFVPVAGYGEQIQRVDIQAGVVHLSALVQGPDDPDCCPTQDKELLFAYKDGELKRVGE